jgi:hypothetical protein
LWNVGRKEYWNAGPIIPLFPSMSGFLRMTSEEKVSGWTTPREKEESK